MIIPFQSAKLNMKGLILMGKRNPNGYGCVTRLSGNRLRPWVVKVTIYDEEGRGRQVPVDYAETEEQGNILLAQYNNNPWNIDRNKVTLVELFNSPKANTHMQHHTRCFQAPEFQIPPRK